MPAADVQHAARFIVNQMHKDVDRFIRIWRPLGIRLYGGLVAELARTMLIQTTRFRSSDSVVPIHRTPLSFAIDHPGMCHRVPP